MEQLAGQVPDWGGVFFVPAFVGLGAPHRDPFARGTILGITRGTTAAHIARAALESMAYQTRDVLDAMQKDAGIELTGLKVDGGAATNSLLMQFQADVLGVPVRRPTVVETTALGAAYLAGLAVGYWKDTADLAQHWALDREYRSSCLSLGGTRSMPFGERQWAARASGQRAPKDKEQRLVSAPSPGLRL